MLRTETRLTCRIDRLPDDYSFPKRGWRRDKVELEAIIFEGSEYVKDGLLPITEWLGQSPWSERAVGIVDDIWKNARVETPFGKIPSLNVEVNGNMLQACSRLFWFTGQRNYLDWAIRLGDYYLLGDQHPTRDMKQLKLRDHGCEIISGLCELYATLSFKEPEKKAVYQPHIHEMLDRILEVGTNEHGLFFNVINPIEGIPLGRAQGGLDGLADTWGYTYNGILAVHQIDGTAKYRDATRKALSHLHHYRDYDWQNDSADSYADAIEGALNLYNRIPVATAAEWIDGAIRVM